MGTGRSRSIGSVRRALLLASVLSLVGIVTAPIAAAAHDQHLPRTGATRYLRRPEPFRRDSAAARQAVAALPVNSSLGDWRSIGPSNFGGKVYGSAVDADNPKDVYAAYEVGGLWGTSNGGVTWRPMFQGQQDVAFASVATHPTVAGVVAAGLIAYGGGYARSLNRHVGIRLSTNAGKTWRNIGPSSDSTATVWNIGFGDSTGQTLYAATDKGLYKTIDQGAHWGDVLPYSGNDFFNDRPSLAIDPLHQKVLLLAQRTVGVMRSSDGGTTWKRVDT